jgi:sarcosine oxidase subunit alpha
MSRLDNLPTLRINPEQPIPFNYAGNSCQGLTGDTIAAALYAGGTRVFSRSLKYHRPRGLYSLDGECSNTCMAVNGIPNVRTETTQLKSGMTVSAQNVRGTPDRDLMGLMDRMDWAMPAGFYYRTLHKPARIWPVALKQVRKMAGIGKISPDFQMPGTFDEIYPATDVCIVGGGPAGMLAAAAAGEKGLRVILLEARPWLGGFFDYRTAAYNSETRLDQRARRLAQRLTEMPNVRIFTGTAVTGAYNNNLITAFQVGGASDPFTERYIEVRAQSVVVATGCI